MQMSVKLFLVTTLSANIAGVLREIADVYRSTDVLIKKKSILKNVSRYPFSIMMRCDLVNNSD